MLLSTLANTSARLPCPQHIEVQDALAAAESGGSDATIGTIVSPDSLPDALREWAVDASEIQYMRHPNGQPIEIGRGASAHVYKAVYRGEVVVSWGSGMRGCCGAAVGLRSVVLLRTAAAALQAPAF